MVRVTLRNIPIGVFQSMYGLAHFVVRFGVSRSTASRRSDKRNHPASTGNKKKILDFGKIQILLTNSKHDIWFEIFDGKLYHPHRVNKAVANCHDDVDRFFTARFPTVSPIVFYVIVSPNTNQT
jgi:hypothetical protein